DRLGGDAGTRAAAVLRDVRRRRGVRGGAATRVRRPGRGEQGLAGRGRALRAVPGVLQGEHLRGERDRRVPVPAPHAAAPRDGALLRALRRADLAGRGRYAPVPLAEGRWPMTIHATLVCGRCKTATLHIFAERRPQKRRPGEFAYVDLVYECHRCGSSRVWGS